MTPDELGDEMAAFVEKRLTEEEDLTRAATLRRKSPAWVVDPEQWATGIGITDETGGSIAAVHGTYRAEHIARHDLARALREIEAKRERLRLLRVNAARWAEVRNDREPFNAFANGDSCGRFNMARRMVALDAAVWRDHPDYDAAWGAP